MPREAYFICVAFLVHHLTVFASRREEAFVTTRADDAESAAAPCDLDGYNLTALRRNSCWSVHFHHGQLSKCLVPDGYNRGHVTGCTLYFTVCGGSVPPDVCGGHSDASTCLEVATTDRRRHFYDIRGKGLLQPIGPKSFDGFIVVREGRHHHDADSRRCGKIEVALKFVCDVDMDWSSLSRDATLHVQRIRHAKGNPCQLEVVFGYAGACHTAPSLAPAVAGSCLLPPYNVTTLTSRSYWFAHVDNRFCYGDGFGQPHDCNFSFAFCQALPYNNPVVGSKCGGAAVCQSALVDSDLPPFVKEVSYSMGQYRGYTRFFFSSKFGGGGFYMEVENGSIPTCGSATKTRVSLVCDASAVWRSQDLSKIIKVEKVDQCQYDIILPYNGACLPVFPNATSLSSSVKLSTISPTTTLSSSATPPNMTSSATPPNVTSSATPPNVTSSATPPNVTSHASSRSANVSSTRTTISISTIRLTSTHTLASSSHKSTHSSATPTHTLTTPTPSVAPPTHTPIRWASVNPSGTHHHPNKTIMGLGIGLGLFGVLSIILAVFIIAAICVISVKKRNRYLKFVNDQ